MTDKTQPDSGRIITSSDILLHDAETALLYEELRAAIDDGHESMTHADALAEIAAIRAENTELRAQLESIGAGGVSGPLVGRTSISANAGEPTKAQIREVFMAYGFTVKEGQTDLKQYVYDAAYALLALAAPPTAQAEGWRPIETAPKGELVLLWSEIKRGEPIVGDWAEYARYNQPQFTHWSRWAAIPPTSAEGVEHG